METVKLDEVLNDTAHLKEAEEILERILRQYSFYDLRMMIKDSQLMIKIERHFKFDDSE